MSAKMTVATVDGMSARVYEAAVLPERTDVGDTKDVVVAVHVRTPNQIGTGNAGDAQDQSLNDKYPTLIKIFEFGSGPQGSAQMQQYEHATAMTLDAAKTWKPGPDVRNPPHDGYVFFRHDMTPRGKKGKPPAQARSYAAISCSVG